MKLGLILLLVLGTQQSWSSSTATKEAMEQWGVSLTLSQKLGCALTEAGVICWGEGKEAVIVPPLKNPTQVSVGTFHACAIEDNEEYETNNSTRITCWGNNDYNQLKVPALKNPRRLSANHLTTCALHEEGISCWGSVDHSPPPLQKVKELALGDHHGCAIVESEVKCWGSNNFGQVDPPPLTNPRQITSGSYHSCALDDFGVQCWGNNSEGQTKVPELVHPRKVSAGHDQTCAIDDFGVQCWGGNEHGELEVPRFGYAADVVTVFRRVCAIDLDRINCWGERPMFELEIPKSVSALFGARYFLQNLDKFLLKFSLSFSSHKAKFLKKSSALASKIPQENLQSSYLLASLIKPLIQNTLSMEVQTIQLRYYERYLGKVQAELNFPEIHKLKLGPQELSLVLNLSALTLTSVRETVVEPSTSEELEDMIFQLGQLQTAVDSKQLSFLEAAKKASTLFQMHEAFISPFSLTVSNKAYAFAKTLLGIAAFLEKISS